MATVSFVSSEACRKIKAVLIIQRHTRRNQNKWWCLCHSGTQPPTAAHRAWLEFLSPAEGSWLEEIKIIIHGRAPHATIPLFYSGWCKNKRDIQVKKELAGKGSGTILEPPGGETMDSLINIFLRLAAVERTVYRTKYLWRRRDGNTRN